jgi:hypothetical protein
MLPLSLPIVITEPRSMPEALLVESRIIPLPTRTRSRLPVQIYGTSWRSSVAWRSYSSYDITGQRLLDGAAVAAVLANHHRRRSTWST